LRSERSKDAGRLLLDNVVKLKKKKSTKHKPLKDYYTLLDENDTTPVFESRFESGNLHSAYRTDDSCTYNLVLENDTNTFGYSQWFFFRVSNLKKGSKVRINIINLLKPKALYNECAKVVTYSEKSSEHEKLGWHRTCENVSYYKNSLYKYVNDRRRNLYTLSFTYECLYDNDFVFFANTIPYTYTDIMSQLNEIQRNEKRYNYIHRKTLCTTLLGNNLDYFTLTSNLGKSAGLDHKKAIVIMARVHPGETVSSWIMDGIIDLLIGDSDEAKYLRDNFIFKVIPMLNPDGVIVGNYRTSLAGCDLNRRWHNPSPSIHPEIFYSKEMILKLSSQIQMGLVVDLHGHSNAYNIFMYGNTITEQPLACKQFPYILSKISNLFSYHQCEFKMQKSKKGTGRINLFNELGGIPNIFTMEASFAGGNLKGEKVYYNTQHLKSMGRDLCRSIITYYSTYHNLQLNETLLSCKMNKDFLNSQINELEAKQVEAVSNNEEDDSGGSDSEPSMDNMTQEELTKILSTKKRTKSNYTLILEKGNKLMSVKKNLRNRKEEIVSTQINLSTNGNKLVVNSTSINTIKKQDIKPIVKQEQTSHHRSTSISKPIVGTGINRDDIVNLIPLTNSVPSINVTIKQNITSTTQNDKNKILNITKTKLTLDIKTPVYNLHTSSKRDSETQTEEIFFKM
jgi:hypothetical protein